MLFKFSALDSFTELQLTNTYDMLSVEQKLYVDSKNEKGKIQSLSARTLLSELLSNSYAELSVRELIRREDGSPYICDDFFVSLTHSDNMVGCAVSQKPVGVDIQQIKPVSKKLISRVCTENEQKFITKNGLSSFHIIWAIKEAYIKATGTSFSKTVGLCFVTDNEISCPYPNSKIEYGVTDGFVWAVYYDD